MISISGGGEGASGEIVNSSCESFHGELGTPPLHKLVQFHKLCMSVYAPTSPKTLVFNFAFRFREAPQLKKLFWNSALISEPMYFIC